MDTAKDKEPRGGSSNVPDPKTRSLKRKQPSGKESSGDPSNARQRKRAKLLDARGIATQTSDKALKSGKLDVNAFVQAREFEIRALEEGMAKAKKSKTRRAFQLVPRDMRRRTASHNVKAVPKRLRARAEKEMIEDNTPTVTARRRAPSSHMRLRLETAKRLHGLAKRAKARKKASKDAKPGPEEHSQIKARPAKVKKTPRNTLANPPRPEAKFRKRQVNKTWLPTHIFHSKRAHMTPPKSPLWRFAIPITPTEKSYRPTHRATCLRGAVAWDMSYMSTIGLEGVPASIEGLLESLGLGAEEIAGGGNANARMREKWKAGKRSWEGWLFENGGWPTKPIAPVLIVWCVLGETPKDVEMPDVGAEEATAKQKKAKPSRRKVFIRVHPSAFLQLWNAVVAVAKTQRPLVMVEDLRFEIGSIEITGPGSTEALLGVLKPVDASKESSTTPEDPSQVWSSFKSLTNPASIPAGALLGFNISDPRLHYPPRTVKQPSTANQPQLEEDLLNTLSNWPPDRTQSSPAIFDRPRRLEAARKLASQKSINRRKGLAMPGAYPNALPSDPEIPILLLASRRPTTPVRGAGGGQGKWTLLLPWKCVLPIWYSLVHYPLSSGGNPRFGGLREIRQAAFESGTSWFPGDYPGTRAGWEWEEMERDRRREEWARRPKGKRTEWESVPLGRGVKGEIGIGWGCDWERLLQPTGAEGQPSGPKDGKRVAGGKGEPKLPLKLAPTTYEKTLTTSKDAAPPPVQTINPNPPSISHVPPPLSTLSLTAPPKSLPVHTILLTVKLTLLTRGRPADCARIYRLPTADQELRKKWLALVPKEIQAARSFKSKNKNKKDTADASGGGAAAHPLRALAASILTPTPQAGDKEYPPVPPEEDLIGFVTSGNYNLGEGRGVGVGCLLLGKVLRGGGNADVGGKGEGRLCIVRDAGGVVGRVARWEVSG
ncbi:MAG: hypothetical protein M1839_006843 [Geoglossum umbratile]|nr:MAG: hypothetical protein M1839_006843 [Geoglossum umbratile]